jgi:hypothetical protein
VRVLVCGGRDLKAEDWGLRLRAFLDTLGVDTLIYGGAPGADTMAGDWARSRNKRSLLFVADWATHGKAAGPKRNARMLAEGRPDLVVAFPGGKGTEDMKRRARAAGVEVREVLP